MSFTTDEQSVQGSTPIELYAFQTMSQAWFFTSYKSDFIAAGSTYVAVPTVRSSINATGATDENGSFTVDLPATHALPQFYASGIPPREILCTVTRYQKSSGFQMVIGQGYVGALSFKGRTASFKIASPSDAFNVQLPTVTASRNCPHVLYDSRCTISRVAFEQDTTIAFISPDRRTVTVASMGNHADGGAPTPDQWAYGGEFVHPGTGERRVITDQTGATLTLTYRLPSQIQVGDVVNVFAGCKHTTTDCFSKFANLPNFGGFPQLPLTNPFYVSIKYTGS